MFHKSGILYFKYSDPQSHNQPACTDCTDLLDFKKQEFFFLAGRSQKEET